MPQPCELRSRAASVARVAALALLTLTAACSTRPLENSSRAIAPEPLATASPDSAQAGVAPSEDAGEPHYRQALEQGMAAAVATQTAQSASDWHQVEGLWQQAIAHLSAIPSGSDRFAIAQQKRQEYEANRAYAARAAAAKTLPTATVVSVGDGDTLRVQGPEGTITLRLACVDAPETNQAFGPEAALRLRQLLPTGQSVTVRAIERDRYDRTVAEIYSGGQSVGLQLVREGYAVVYTQYLDGCAATAADYRQAEAAARAAGLNFWSQPQPTLPWDFRRGGSAAPGAAPPSVPTVPAPTSPAAQTLPACVATDCNCSDFSSWAQAQAVLEAFPGDPHRLDGDGDGIACESLR
ncbi:thermonuclease family protein [Leptolyngbya sp. KIOST-1]|uniref:thermonuclease family protein n=1 Tax=Leptolyngbya sp. KIOST-1 TaxID=1229172 RepID=UPI000A74DA38|nr:thermonuclease family protein [Leptolyngbya sp. KIOST-1]